MKINELTNYLEEIAPLAYQEDYDNAGLIVGDPQVEITSVLIALDTTPEIIAEAKSLGANVVVAHHPIIFKGLKKLNGKTYIEKAVMLAIKNDIAIYAIHTNLDNVHTNGVNSKISEKLGLISTAILSPKLEIDEKGRVGSGMIGDLSAPQEELHFLDFLKNAMNLSVIKHTNLLGKPIAKVAVCGGSGGFLLENAKKAGADVFITSDYKYHEYFDANDEIVIIDIGHYESEQYTVELLFELITKKFSNFAAHCTKLVTNPINYY